MILFHFTRHQQTTRLETKEQHHWVMHWNQTLHSQISIWEVKTKENNTQIAPINNSHFSTFIKSSGNKIGERGVASLSDALKVNTALSQLNLCRKARMEQQMTSINNSLFFCSHKNNREQYWRKGNTIIGWTDIKQYTDSTKSERWQKKKEATPK